MKIFLGYPSEHEETAWQVFEFLRSKGDDVWFDKVSLIAGVDWDQERDRGQREAELVVHLCSEAILKRAGVVNREIRQTLRLVEDQPLGSLYVIPIRLEPIKMPVELTRFQYFDFGDGWEERLLDGVEKRRAQLAGNISEPPRPQITEEKPLPGLQKIEFEDVTEAYECRGEYLRYDEDGLYWTFVNGTLANASLSSFYDARCDFRSMDDSTQEKPEWLEGVKHEWSVNVEEAYRNGDLLSVRFYTYIGFAGAAHPNHYITTLNFLGDDAGSVTIEQLLGHSGEYAQKVLAYCEKVILAEFEEEITKDTFFEGYKETEEQVWRLLAQFNFDRQGMTFNFSPYDVLPYVFGSHEVHVPWRFIEPMLAEAYKMISKG